MVYEITKLGKKPIIRNTENYFFLNLNDACIELNKKDKEIKQLKYINKQLKNRLGKSVA